MTKKLPEIVKMLQKARQEHWALGQFNLSTLETLQAIVIAANENRSPVIVGVSMGSIKHVGLSYLQGLLQAAKEEALVPLYFHLDHGLDISIVEECIEIGFHSVMIDASNYPLIENVKITQQVVELAHGKGVGVEAQVGETWDEETGQKMERKTDPFEAQEFVEATGIDYLAISFGNTPGRLNGQADVDLHLVRKIASLISLPLVLHGGSSIPPDDVQSAIKDGAAKINIDTVIRKAVTGSMQEAYCQSHPPSDPRKAFAQARDAAKLVVGEKMKLFGSINRVS